MHLRPTSCLLPISFGVRQEDASAAPKKAPRPSIQLGLGSASMFNDSMRQQVARRELVPHALPTDPPHNEEEEAQDHVISSHAGSHH
eukprot:6767112-Prymnesium_polylepis.1